MKISAIVLSFLIMFFSYYLYISTGSIKIEFVGVTPTVIQVFNKGDERLRAPSKEAPIVSSSFFVSANEFAYYNIFVQFSNDSIFHIYLCHENSWSQDQIVISRDEEDWKLMSIM